MAEIVAGACLDLCCSVVIGACCEVTCKGCDTVCGRKVADIIRTSLGAVVGITTLVLGILGLVSVLQLGFAASVGLTVGGGFLVLLIGSVIACNQCSPHHTVKKPPTDDE
jgi:hypothetical protein